MDIFKELNIHIQKNPNVRPESSILGDQWGLFDYFIKNKIPVTMTVEGLPFDIKLDAQTKQVAPRLPTDYRTITAVLRDQFGPYVAGLTYITFDEEKGPQELPFLIRMDAILGLTFWPETETADE